MKGSSSVNRNRLIPIICYYYSPYFPPCLSSAMFGSRIQIKSDLFCVTLCLQKEEVIRLANGLFLLQLARRQESQQTMAIAHV